MKTFKKVLWTEGTLLGQQHFQQWEESLRAEWHFFIRCIAPFHYGLKTLVIDEEALQYGKLIIKKCQAIFPHGLIIDYDIQHAPPLECTLLTETSPVIHIFLATPMSTSASGISGYRSTQNPAWIGEYKVFADLFDAEREREILIGQPSLKLLLKEHNDSGYYAIKILEVEKNHHDSFHLRENYIPTVLSIESSPALLRSLRQQIEQLSAKARLLSRRCQETQATHHKFNHPIISDFLLLITLNTTLIQLQSLLSTPKQHPFVYYQHLLHFFASLMTFQHNATDAKPIEYHHKHLHEVFSTLCEQFKKQLENIMPSPTQTLTWQRVSDVLYVIDDIDRAFLQKSHFYLAVSFESNTKDWLDKFTRQIKVGSHSMIETILSSALPGVIITHIARPPNKLFIKAGFEYFYLEPTGPFWSQVLQERTLALFTGETFVNARIEIATYQEQ